MNASQAALVNDHYKYSTVYFMLQPLTLLILLQRVARQTPPRIDPVAVRRVCERPVLLKPLRRAKLRIQRRAALHT